MPRKSTKVVADANAEIVNVAAPVPVDTPASESKKRAPVKRANKKEVLIHLIFISNMSAMMEKISRIHFQQHILIQVIKETDI